MKVLRFFGIIAVLMAFQLAASAKDFQADVVSTHGGQSITGKMYVSTDKCRMEMPGSIMISRGDQKKVFVLMPTEKMYMEQAYDPSYLASAQSDVEGQVDRTLIGRDNIEGRSCSKYKVTYEMGSHKSVMYQWQDDASGMIIKSQAEDGEWSMEFKNIKTGPVNPSLFEIPSGYSKFSLDMGSMLMGRSK